MKIQVMSDLHMEFFNASNQHLGKIQVHPEADVIVLAGDIDTGFYSLKRAVELFRDFGAWVIFVPGNHEFYNQKMEDILKFCNHNYDGVTMLTGLKEYGQTEITLNGVKFVGGTLWTDFKLYEGSRRMPTVEEAKTVGGGALNDFYKIEGKHGTFTPQESIDLHNEMIKNINEELDKPFIGKKVLITHHGVHLNSVHPKYWADSRYLNSPKKLPGESLNWMLNPCFTSNLPELLGKVDLAIHGHTHESLDYRLGKTRVVANPRGYPLTYGTNMAFENPSFDPLKIIEI